MKQDFLVFFIAGIVLASLLPPAALAQFQYQRLESFGTSEQTGTHPNRLVEASDGALYGTTSDGGTIGAGTVFKLQRDGSGFTILHHFLGTVGDGAQPPAALIEGRDGALYGTTVEGGTNAAGPDGTVFKLNKDGSGYTVLHSFSQAGGDAAWPLAALVEGSDGALYGTTVGGGTNACGTDGCGTVFKLNKDGRGYMVLRSFSGGAAEGANPTAALIEGSDGMLYGTTRTGGITNCNDRYGIGSGTVFKLNKAGSGYAVLRSFTGGVGDGQYPSEDLLQGSDGVLYGTTAYGGANGFGTVFKLNKDGGGYAVLWSLSGGADIWLRARLVEGNDGTLYGTTLQTLFKLNKDGSGQAVLRSSTDVETGEWAHPKTGLVKGSDGALYGTTWDGGNMGLGTIFVLRPQPLMLLPIVSGVGVTVRFTSMPGSTHRLQRAGTLSGSWLTLTNLVVPTNGLAEFTDPASSDPRAFYRTVAP